MLKKLGLGDDLSKVEASAPASKGSGKGDGSSGLGSQDQHLTPSGKTAGGWTMPPSCGWLAAPWFPGMAPPDQSTGCAPTYWPYGSFIPTAQAQANKKRARASKRPRVAEPEEQESDSDDESDTIHLLDEVEALELIEFDTSVAPKDSWEALKPIVSFLEKHFNKSLSEDE